MKTTEHQHQVAIFDWASWNEKTYPELKALYAIPNGEKRPPGVGKKLKAEGVKPGYPDIGLDIAKSGYHGLRIELKTKEGRLSTDQALWLERLSDNGYVAGVCIGAGSAIETICNYLGIENNYGD